MKKLEIVEVTWFDAWSNLNHTYAPADLAREPDLTVRATGYLANEDKRGVDLAMQCSPDQGTFRHVLHIPRQNIRKIQRKR